MGLSVYEYYSMTERQYVSACKGFALKQQKDWEPIRFLAWITVNLNTTKPLSSPQKLLKLTLIDEEEVVLNKEEISKMFERLRPKELN